MVVLGRQGRVKGIFLQYILITVGEVLFSISGLAFAYTQVIVLAVLGWGVTG